jgi:crossover junction endodeoxyribonuclease RuvC
VTAMVTRILRLPTSPTPADAADALALAICQIWRGSAVSRLDEAMSRAASRAASSRSVAARSAPAARWPRANR